MDTNLEIYRKKKNIMQIIKDYKNKIEMSVLIAVLHDYMAERLAKEYIKNMVNAGLIDYKYNNMINTVFISVTAKGNKYMTKW